MANTFKIVITAADKATATVRKVKAGVASFTKPIRDVKASVSSLGKEIGIDRLAKGIGGLTQRAGAFAVKLGSVVAGLTAVAGIGSVAAIAEMARDWGLAGASLLRFTAITDTAVNRVQTLRGAAEMMGLEAGQLDTGLKAVGDTLENAVFGRDQNALIMMNRLGITMKRTKNGSVDAVEGLMNVADAIVRVKNVQAQGIIARTFGVEDLLPLLQKGSKGIKEFERAVRSSGAVLSGPALEQSRRFQYGLALLKLNIEGVKNSILAGLAPSIVPLITNITNWTGANRGLIATNAADFVNGSISVIKTLVTWVGNLVNALGGWKNAGIAVATMMAGRLLLSVVGIFAPLIRLIGLVGYLAITSLPMLAVRAGIAAEALGLEGLASAFVALGVAIEATPIGWILTAIAALGLGGYELWKHWKDIGPFFNRLWDGVTNSFMDGYKRIAPIIHAMSALPFVGTAFTGVDMAFQALQMRQDMKTNKNAQPNNKASALQAQKFFTAQGWSKEQAAGITGNLAWESGLNPRQSGDRGTAYGIGQWHKPRQLEFARQFGKDIHQSSLAEQLAFVQYELTKGADAQARAAGDRLRRSRTAADAAAVVNVGYERPANPAASQGQRAGIAENILKLAADAARGGQKPGEAAKPHKIDIALHGAPKGTTVKVSGGGHQAPRVGVKVETAMVDLTRP